MLKLNKLGYKTLRHPAHLSCLLRIDYRFLKHSNIFLSERCFENKGHAKHGLPSFVVSREKDSASGGMNEKILVSRNQSIVPLVLILINKVCFNINYISLSVMIKYRNNLLYNPIVSLQPTSRPPSLHYQKRAQNRSLNHQRLKRDSRKQTLNFSFILQSLSDISFLQVDVS